ncbi:MAG: hypothetical protein MZV49_06695 [Rhodopseudomonas palustris]|nr:hypothetical protein [Rhodopseudomonas palustris]
MGLLGILLGLALLIWLAVPRLERAAAGAGWPRWSRRRSSGEPLLAHWTQTFMGARGGLRRAVLPAVPARRPVRQADGGQRLGAGDRRASWPRSSARGARSWRWCSPARW